MKTTTSSTAEQLTREIVGEATQQILQKEIVKMMASKNHDSAQTQRMFSANSTYLSWEIAMGCNDFVSDFLDCAHALKLDISKMVNRSPGKGLFDNTALHVAVAKGWPAGHAPGDNGNYEPQKISNLELVKKLIRAGADPNLRNSQSENRFLTADDIRDENCPNDLTLDKWKAEQTFRANNYPQDKLHPLLGLNHTPLSLAVIRGDIEMINIILCSDKLKTETVSSAYELTLTLVNDDNFGADPIMRETLLFPKSAGFDLFQEVPNNEKYRTDMLMILDKCSKTAEDMKEIAEILGSAPSPRSQIQALEPQSNLRQDSPKSR